MAGQDTADRLNPERMLELVDERYERLYGRSSSAVKNRGRLQDLAGSSQLGDLRAQPFDLGGVLAGGAGPLPGSDLGCAHPGAHRLGCADPQFRLHRLHRGPLGRVIRTDLRDHAHRTLTKLRRVGDERAMTRSPQGIEPPSDPDRFTRRPGPDRCAGGWPPADRPHGGRTYRSRTRRTPSRTTFGHRMMSATHKWLGTAAVNARFTRSGRVSAALPGRVVRGMVLMETPFRPAALISRATVHRATGRPATPSSRVGAA